MSQTFTLPFNLIVTLGYSPIAKQLRPFLRLGKVILFILFHLFFLNAEDNFAIKEQKRVLVQLKDVFNLHSHS